MAVFLRFALVLLVGLLSACVWKPDPGVAPLKVLDQGVPVLTIAADEVVVGVAVRAGYGHDPVGKEGLAWVTANMLAHGGTPVDSAEDMRRRMGQAGSLPTFRVTADFTSYHLEALQGEEPEELVARVAAMLAHPDLSDDTLTRTIQETLSDLRCDGDNLATLALTLWIYEGHPYGHPCHGRTGSLPTITALDVRQFWQRTYVRGALQGYVVAPAAQKDALALALAQGLAPLPARLAARPVPAPVASPAGRKVLLVHAPDATTRVAIGALAVGTTDLRSAILGWALLPSRLEAALREANLGATVQFTLAGLLQPGWGVTAEVQDPAQIGEVIRIALETIELYAQTGPPEAELQTALAGALIRPPPAIRAYTEATEGLLGLQGVFSQQANQLPALTPALVNAELGRTLHPDDLRLVVVTPDPDAVRAALREDPAASAVQEGGAAPAAKDAGKAAPPTYRYKIDAVLTTTPEELVR